MIRFSKDKNINNFVVKKIKLGWKWKKGKKHHMLISPQNYKIPIPSTPSDYRAYLNFIKDIRLLENKTSIILNKYKTSHTIIH
ncbi:hypothetical protein AM202_00510 [Actinobacillus minor 202]|uniref:Uncharacterized protein n=1 Tax=Actinobacillus minor 202 TaxID=591023 RepID=A0ABP2GRV9_9PAST|nr:hypothetical protein [Actinobacillus minor]EEV24662.1 hypothetical protein AM202_00510 [Actinobacillus minor 202]